MEAKRQTYLSYSANILVPRLLIETKVLVQAKAHVVAIKTVGELLEVEKVLLERACDRRLRIHSFWILGRKPPARDPRY